MITISTVVEDENGNLIEVPVPPTPFDGDETIQSSDDLRRLPEAMAGRTPNQLLHPPVVRELSVEEFLNETSPF